MIGLLEFKKALGSKIEELSEEEVLKLRENQEQMAELFFAMWVEKLKNEKTKV
jgi:hypothetical protein